MMAFLGSIAAYSNYAILIALLATAIAVLRCNGYIASVITLNVFSLLSALEYAVLGAPDVSITEASINACFGCILLLCAGYLIKFDMGKMRKISFTGGACILSSFIAVCLMMSSFPIFGLATNPVVTSGEIYNKLTVNLMQFPNIVTAILAGFRGFDTMWETVVIFSAAVSVFAIMRDVK